MIGVLVFVVAVPLSVELFGAFYAVIDAWRHAESRAAAVERLAIPLLFWSALWWWVGPDAWYLLAAAWAFVIVCHITVFYCTRWLIRHEKFQTTAIETDSDAP